MTLIDGLNGSLEIEKILNGVSKITKQDNHVVI
jgi:hypothetical protein